MTETLEEHMRKQNAYNTVGDLVNALASIGDRIRDLEQYGDPREWTRAEKRAGKPMTAEQREKEAERLSHMTDASVRDTAYWYEHADIPRADALLAGIEESKRIVAKARADLKRVESLLEPWNEFRAAMVNSERARKTALLDLARAELDRRDAASVDNHPVTYAELMQVLENQQRGA